MHDEEAEPEDNLIKRWLTIPGRLLLILTIIGFAAAFYFLFLASVPLLPPGRYPLWFWVLPTGLGSAAVFGIAAMVLESIGVKVFRRVNQSQ